ncbi:MAG: hypothetical protein NTX53_16120, partial [candidate division WOR-3 bacterium]|nr:hypothetical protein [candidate division WOR-3 bacterium]
MKKFQVPSPKSQVGPALLSVFACLILFCQKPLPSPGPVGLVAPADNAVLRSGPVDFTWLTPEWNQAYLLQVGLDVAFKRFQSQDTLWSIGPGWSDTTGYLLNLPDGRYWWRVRSLGWNDVWGEWSETRRFDLERFRVVTSIKTQGYPHDIETHGGRAYIADGQAGLAMFDVTNPESPMLMGVKMDSMNVAWGVAVSGNYAYITYGSKELYIVDASRPESLKVAGELEYPQPSYGYDVAVRDSFAFLAADAQFIIVNVAQPSYPNLVFQYRYPHDCRDVAVSGDYCYLACGQLGVAVWKVESLPPRQVA